MRGWKRAVAAGGDDPAIVRLAAVFAEPPPLIDYLWRVSRRGQQLDARRLQRNGMGLEDDVRLMVNQQVSGATEYARLGTLDVNLDEIRYKCEPCGDEVIERIGPRRGHDLMRDVCLKHAHLRGKRWIQGEITAQACNDIGLKLETQNLCSRQAREHQGIVAAVGTDVKTSEPTARESSNVRRQLSLAGPEIGV